MGLLSRFIGRDTQQQALEEISNSYTVAKCEPEDCDSCSERYPSSLSIDTSSPLWGSAKPWRSHILCATGKTDWVHSVTDEFGTLANALDASSSTWNAAEGGRVIISNSSLSPPDEYFEHEADLKSRPTRALILPEFIVLDGITPLSAPTDMAAVTEALHASRPANKSKELSSSLLSTIRLPTTSNTRIEAAGELAYVLLCSHRTRDKRCAITATILQKRFDEELRELDLYRDPSDNRAGGVRVACVSHIGGHKFAANVMIYLKSGQAVWLARVRPEHVANIVKHCILKGEVFPDLMRAAFKSNPIDW